MAYKAEDKTSFSYRIEKKIDAVIGRFAAIFKDGEEIGKNAYDFFKQMTKCIFATDKLVYTITLMAEKERDGNLDNIARMLESVRNSLTPYKFKTKGKEDLSGLVYAVEKTESVIAALDLILERDKDFRAKRAR